MAEGARAHAILTYSSFVIPRINIVVIRSRCGMSTVQPSLKIKLAGAFAGLSLAVSLAAPVFAQDAATPIPGEVVAGAECTTPGRPVTFLGDLIATPRADEEYVTPTAVPDGTPVDEA